MQFKDIIGHQAVKQRLIQSVGGNRVSHAQLFLGSTEAGSLALALAYAQYITCENKSVDDSCGKCPACIKYNKYIHPDLHFAYPVALSKEKGKEVETSTDVAPQWREALLANPYMSLNDWFNFLDAENKQPIIGVKESGEILRKLSLTTYEAEYKIMVIWMTQKMNTEAANKLLKILEEPPEKTLFLLVCENGDQLLKTITSRTQLVKINKIDDASLVQALKEKFKLEDIHARSIAQLAEGNFNVAKKLVQENEDATFHLTTFQTWMRACIKFDIKKINELIEQLAKLGREQQKIFLSYCLHLVRESTMLNYGDTSLVRLTEKEMEFMKKFSPYIHAGNVLLFTEELNTAYMHIERNAYPKILLLDMSFKFNEFLNVKQTV